MPIKLDSGLQLLTDEEVEEAVAPYRGKKAKVSAINLSIYMRQALILKVLLEDFNLESSALFKIASACALKISREYSEAKLIKYILAGELFAELPEEKT